MQPEEAELRKLREILLGCGLAEQFKWRKPCYSYGQGNVAVLMRYKEFAAVNLLKGVLLEDPNGVLIAPGENSQSARQLRFTSVQEIGERESVMRRFSRGSGAGQVPGHGLGLALVAAVAKRHGAKVKLDDAAPGLIVTVRFRRFAGQG
jgi:hypothetical protein